MIAKKQEIVKPETFCISIGLDEIIPIKLMLKACLYLIVIYPALWMVMPVAASFGWDGQFCTDLIIVLKRQGIVKLMKRLSEDCMLTV